VVRRNTVAKVGKGIVSFDRTGKGIDAQAHRHDEGHHVEPKARGPPAVVDPLLTVEEVAELLRCSVSCLNKWRVLGVGPHFVRIGKRVRYHRAAVAAYIAQQTRVSTSAEIAPAA
jgi:excisionase family DNA binding protein